MKVGRSWRADAGDRLIAALDVQGREEAEDLVGSLDGLVSFYKIGLRMHLCPGMVELALSLARSGKKVFWDMKGADIPETLRGYSAAAGQAGFGFITIHGSPEVSDAAIRAAVDGKDGTDLRILLVTVLTSLEEKDVAAAYRTTSIRQLVEHRAQRAIRLGCDGVIASPQEAAMIRRIADDHGAADFLIVTPGVRPRGSTAHDQKRVATPFEAIRDGADYLVIGRPIIEADDRQAAARAIIAEIERGLEARASLTA